MTDLVAIAGNLHNEAAAARYLTRRSRADHPGHFDIGFVSEAQKFRPRRILKSAPGHTYHAGPAGMGDNDAGRETAILTDLALPDLGGGSYFLSPLAPAFNRVGKERWGHDRVTRLGDTQIAAITLHPVPAPLGLRRGSTDSRLVQLHHMATAWLASIVTHHRRLGREVIVGGDLNVREHWAGAGHVRSIIDRHELAGIWDGLDLLMASPGLEVVSAKAIDDFPSNHPLLRLELNLRKEK